MNRLLPRIYLMTVLTITLFLSACSEPQVNEKNEEVVYKVPVETVSLENKNIKNTYKTTAVLEAKSESKVTNKVTGMINNVLVEEGMQVKKGQILALIDDESYQLEYERASIDLASATAEYNRSKPNKGKQLISAKDLEKLEFLVKSRRNQQQITAIKVRDSKVRAPISGVIASRSVKAGNMTSGPDSEMFHIVALDNLQGVVYLPEVQMNSVHLGQKARLRFPANGDKEVSAQIVLVSPIIDTQSGTFKVTLQVTNDQGNLKPGMFAKVALTLDEHKNVQVVPLKALLVTDSETSLFVIKDNKANKIIVETGYEEAGFVEILTPLDIDSQIVIVGQQSLKAESLVIVINKAHATLGKLPNNKNNIGIKSPNL
ncbi:hypothetical protein CJF42_02865 [Pseudoalteromonas sp. NBT06-2]|uniref:efflux RND transporter periplasmic adaptor subunit n=1 Tax=Pseudoalteromonas sp. NBT06-2 TaxID=2025950 RepID=UPI000BA70A65|nr:efflux RND transporter periplasmic adaptor subunit [Pseudoalteromonas sp. NBT06-2]PAJ75802.1 hypothetical protein CJF42_02865 [Pseudoalteromonas sp. NBT06-2]